MELLKEGFERLAAGVGALACGGEEDAVEIARPVGRSQEPPLPRTHLDEPRRPDVVEHDLGSPSTT